MRIMFVGLFALIGTAQSADAQVFISGPRGFVQVGGFRNQFLVAPSGFAYNAPAAFVAPRTVFVNPQELLIQSGFTYGSTARTITNSYGAQQLNFMLNSQSFVEQAPVLYSVPQAPVLYSVPQAPVLYSVPQGPCVSSQLTIVRQRGFFGRQLFIGW